MAQPAAAALAALAATAPGQANEMMMMPMWFTCGVDTVLWFKWWHPTTLPTYVSFSVLRGERRAASGGERRRRARDSKTNTHATSPSSPAHY